MKMDHISIDNLEVFANHGVFEEEVNLGQKFLVSVKMFFDASAAGKTDDLAKSVNYADVCLNITEWMKTNRCNLIETVAERLAAKLLRELKIVHEVEVTVKKPWAPIGLPLECVSITIRRGWHTVYLSVGSNMGDREGHISAGIDKLKANEDIRVIRVSELIETEPYGEVEQDDFLNGAVKLETMLTPGGLLDVLHDIENSEGRERKEHWGPRTLDLDILLYDDLVYEEEDLVIPHYDMANRDFVLRPLKEIAPHAVHPVLGKTIGQLFFELNEK